MVARKVPAKKRSAKKKHSQKKSGATRNADQQSSGLSWLGMGAFVGLFVAFLVYLDRIPNKEQTQKTTIRQSDKNSSIKAEADKKPPQPKHQFDFYTVLPEREVNIIEDEKIRSPRKTVAQKTPSEKKIPQKEIKTSSQANTTKKQAEASRNKSESIKKAVPEVVDNKSYSQSSALFQLQVGAFKELSKADAMKARLAFMGVESNIQVIYSKGQKMYRVRVGPSSSSKKINRIKAQLKAQNINTFLQKLDG